MKRTRNPLDEEFDIDDPSLDDEFEQIKIPEDAELNDIKDLALKAYKDIFDMLHLILPQDRLKYMDLGERYLNQAKDAEHKRQRLKLEKHKVLRGEKGKGGQKEPTEEGSGSPSEKTFDRSDLLKQVNKK